MTENEILNSMYNDMQGIRKGIEELQQGVGEVNQRVFAVEKKVTDIQLMLENEIRANIQRVAEGHFDLLNNIYEIMLLNGEMEMLAIKVRMLESDMRELKQKSMR